MVSRPLVLLRWLLALVALALAAQVLAQANAVQGFALTVSDAERSAAFYEAALGFKRVEERTIVDPAMDALTGVFAARIRRITLRLGEETVALEQFLAPTGHPRPVDGRSYDLWFQHMAIVVADMDRAHAHVAKHGVRGISSAPQTIPASNVAAAGIRAFKFLDPDGHPLELLYFPPDKGDPRWHQPRGALFLGIDHSAITVSDTERSAAFYRDLLGFSIAGQSLNTGPTQEQLDNAFGAVVRVTGLRPAKAVGPGIEFLHYLTPSGGRPAPLDARTSDLVHMRSIVEVASLEALLPVLERSRTRFISPRIVEVRDADFRRGLMVKDPDGHAVLLIER